MDSGPPSGRGPKRQKSRDTFALDLEQCVAASADAKICVLFSVAARTSRARLVARGHWMDKALCHVVIGLFH